MQIERFKQLAETYGADFQCWPDAERAAGWDAARRDPAFAQVLEGAGQLDDMLDAWVAPSPSAALRDRILASAPAPRKVLGRGVRFWLSGAGLATAGVFGVLCGAAGSTAALADARDEALVASATSDGLGSIGKLADEGRMSRMVEQNRAL